MSNDHFELMKLLEYELGDNVLVLVSKLAPSTALDILRQTKMTALDLIERRSDQKCELEIETNEPNGDQVELTVNGTNDFSSESNCAIEDDLFVFSFCGGVNTPQDFRTQEPYHERAIAFCTSFERNDLLTTEFSAEHGVIFRSRNLITEMDKHGFGALIRDLKYAISDALLAIAGEESSNTRIFNASIVRRKKPDREGSRTVRLQNKTRIHLPNSIEYFGETDTFPSFENVVGCADAKRELERTAYLFAHPDIAAQYKLKESPHTILYGPPGNGKTMLAHATARKIKECGMDINLLRVNFNKIWGRYYGDSEKEAIRLFDAIIEAAPCVAYFEELDSIGFRSENMDRISENRVINIALAGFDKIATIPDILMLGATNMPQAIDPALLRAGRFSKMIKVPQVNREGLVALLQRERSQCYPTCSISDPFIERLVELLERNWNASDVSVFFRILRERAVDHFRLHGTHLTEINEPFFNDAYLMYEKMRNVA